MISSRGTRVAGLLLATGIVGFFAVGAAPGLRYYDQFWPTGLATAALLACGPARRRELLGVLGVVALITFLSGDVPVLTAVGLALGVVVESGLVSAILTRGTDGRRLPSLQSNSELIRFLLAATAGAVAAGLVTGLLAVVGGRADVAYIAVAIFVARLASELLIVPLVCRVDHHRPLAGRLEHVVQWSVALGATAVLLLLPVGLSIVALAIIPLLGWGAMRLSVREVLWQTIIVASVIVGTTTLGHGSFSGLPELLGLPFPLRNSIASAFIVDCVFVVLPLAVAVAEQVGSVRIAAAERDKLENIVDSATGVAIIGADARGRVTLFNPGAERMLGWTAAEVLGRSTRMFHSAEAVATKARELGVRPDFEAVARVLARPGHAATDMGFLRKDGAERVHSMTLTPLIGENGQELGFVSTSEDVTERVRAASVLREALTAEREAVDRLREVDAVKDAFVSTVSHELRTPITSILGYVEMLEDGTYGHLSRAQSEAMTRVASNSTRLLVLIDELLTLSRVQQNGIGMSTRPFDLRAVVASGHDLVAPTWRTRDLAVSLHMPDQPVDFLGDKDMVERVVVNLVGNAVKFTPDGGSVAVDLGLEGHDAVLRVSDTGIGIPEEEQAYLFQRFFRASTAQQQHIRGTGLGLSITKAIVEQHHGTVRVQSNAETGSTFEVRMPARAG